MHRFFSLCLLYVFGDEECRFENVALLQGVCRCNTRECVCMEVGMQVNEGDWDVGICVCA